MAGRWAAAGESNGSAPAVLAGWTSHSSAAAVNAAHVDITASTAALAARVNTHFVHVDGADAGYLATEADAAGASARVIGV
ncbi:hypothetical protein AWC13_06500 [Mycobacterium kubicae]|nr:hypothetical protein AWC13_06500 [Mycobacterium kubicae]